jgi:4,4'-diaponeurosporenoate glycosyltransferase
MKSTVEELSAFFNLTQAAASNAFTLLGAGNNRQKPFGPVLVMRRNDYFSFGGHEAVKDSVIENYSLADKLREHQIPLRCFIGKNTAHFRMYTGGIGDIINGWNKSIAKGAKGTPPGVFIAFFLWLTGALGTTRHLVTASLVGPDSLFPWLLVCYALYVFQIHRWLRSLGSFRPLTSLFFPVPALFFVFVFCAASAS